MVQIDVVQQFGNALLCITQPARYIGGEYHIGSTVSVEKADFSVGICFPDLYEIGMSNHALRILYDIVRSVDEKILCDRVFAVAPDYEQLLRTHQVPLFTLDYGIPLCNLDLLAISVGYELSATNILQVLELGKIPLHADERREEDPIIIAGGPAVTNPLPFSLFFDAVFIGEAEAGFSEIIKALQAMKQTGASRKERLDALRSYDCIWHPSKARAKRALYDEFSHESENRFVHYIVPNVKVAQDNGVVELMRGCPNGCRFCHAGQYYKPYRQKSAADIEKQVRQYVEEVGYREITLSSLSSGDYQNLQELVEKLNDRYAPHHVSFSLPSLKVSSFSLGILEKISEVRKSGLTFAIETPLPRWQRTLNKEVSLDQVISIMCEAKARGWRLAKFYFMVGLPFIDAEEERSAIVDFVQTIHQATGMAMHMTIGTFVPKPHTPFQWARQMDPAYSYRYLASLKKDIQGSIKKVKVSYHDPFKSYIEGIISRGDKNTGLLIEQAYRLGCRLDAWDEYFARQTWEQAIGLMPFVVDAFLFSEHDPNETLPWDSVSLLVSKRYLQREWQKAKEALLTAGCAPACTQNCGVCTQGRSVSDAPSVPIQKIGEATVQEVGMQRPVLFFYRKTGKAIYISHIHVIRIFEQVFQRANIRVAFTQGYNPKPKMEFVNPLSMGISGSAEVMMAVVQDGVHLDAAAILDRLNASCPDGFAFTKMVPIDTNQKVTLSKYLRGSVYRCSNIKAPQLAEKLDMLASDHIGHVKVVKENDSYTVLVAGDTNPVKAVFGNEVDKFSVLSSLRMHREQLCVDMDTLDDFSGIAQMIKQA